MEALRKLAASLQAVALRYIAPGVPICSEALEVAESHNHSVPEWYTGEVCHSR